jgi:hypothetical protein
MFAILLYRQFQANAARERYRAQTAQPPTRNDAG